MQHIHDIITEIDAYCARRGIKPSTLCDRATNNPRLYERLRRRQQKTLADAEALRAYMAANPVPTTEKGATPDEQD